VAREVFKSDEVPLKWWLLGIGMQQIPVGRNMRGSFMKEKALIPLSLAAGQTK
jgi:hypothetical protein